MVEKTLILKQISGMLCLLNSYSKFTQPMLKIILTRHRRVIIMKIVLYVTIKNHGE